MNFPRFPRRQERATWSAEVRVEAAENDLDQNDREHVEMRAMIASVVDKATQPLVDEIKELRTRVDRLTWALATAAVSFGLMALTFVMTR